MCVSHLMKWLSEKKEFLRSSTGGRLSNVYKSYKYTGYFLGSLLCLYVKDKE